MMHGNIQKILASPIQSIKGVGQTRALLLQKLGLFCVEDVITYFPRDYEDRSQVKRIIELKDGEECSFEGVLVSRITERKVRKGLTLQTATIRDDTGEILASWFNQGYLKQVMRPGERYVFYGRIRKKFNRSEVQNPVFEKVDSGRMKKTCGIIPVYPSTAKLSQSVIRNTIDEALKMVDGKLLETLPDWIREKYSLSEINYSFRNIHFPQEDEDFRKARYRLVFEELLLLQLGLLGMKYSVEESASGIRFGAEEEVKALVEKLPFKLTDAQKRVFHEIERDMESEKVMNRLVQGDVSSGKTVVAVLALYKAVKSGFQGAFMVPTGILADQHFHTVTKLLQNTGVRVARLTGNLSQKQKDETIQAIREGQVDIVVGTHALIEEAVVFHKLGLVVTDEQHRFGVRQRALLAQKGTQPDILVMTATPIPRTLALILYGDLDISVIDELPPGRKPVETYAVDESMRERVNRFIRKKVEEGRQVYIVCPLVEESEEVDAKSATEMVETIACRDFKDLRVGLIHGKMKPAEKEKVMDEFVRGDIDILVSTTVIEVGINVPNATVMVVENAERFGLAQIHQLRGRVGRGEHSSYCILFNQSKSDIARERMKILQSTGDGFVIAEKDMKLRGPGEFFGTRQHGIPDLKIANLYRDMEILKKAHEAAVEILNRDRKLLLPEHAGLRDGVFKRFTDRLGELSMN